MILWINGSLTQSQLVTFDKIPFMKKKIALLSILVVNLVFAKAQINTYQQRKKEQIAGPSVFQKDIDGKTGRIEYQDSLITILGPLKGADQLPIHLLGIPNKRIPTLNDVTANDQFLLGHIIYMLKQVAKQKGIDSTGYRIAINTNEDAGQSAFHIHAHLLGGGKTGPMVDQSWRNIQRARNALVDTLFRTNITTNNFLVKLMGHWQNIQEQTSLHCEPELNFKYMKLNYKRPIKAADNKITTFEGTAIYKAENTTTLIGSWYDTNGDLLNIEASIEANTLTALWGNATSMQGKTVYQLLNDNTLEVTDYLKNKTGNWQQFNKVKLTKEW